MSSSEKDEFYEGGFIPLPHPMIKHEAFRQLSEASIRVLLCCIRKTTNKKGTQRYNVIFKFTFVEAKKDWGLSDSTFQRAMKQLHTVGFIDYWSPGALYNDVTGKRGPRGYRLSRRWKRWKKNPDERKASGFEEHAEGYYVAISG